MPSEARDLSSYVAGWRARSRSRRDAERARTAAVRARLGAAVEVLTRQFGATQVVLFGSFARGEGTLHSDVDLLVSGLDPARWSEASAAIDRLVREAHVDLVPESMARPEIRLRAQEEGEVLHDGT